MFVFDLKCRSGHTFEEWFASSAEYQAKRDDHALRCPECGDQHVEKAITAARINGGATQPAASTPCGLPQCGTGACAFGEG